VVRVRRVAAEEVQMAACQKSVASASKTSDMGEESLFDAWNMLYSRRLKNLYRVSLLLG